MNDVVIKYIADITSNENNEITSSVVKYTVLWSGASFNNDFDYYDPNILKGAETSISGSSASVIDTENGVIRLEKSLLSFANKDDKRTITVTTKYTSPIAKNSYIRPPYNPFISIKGDRSIEVHMTNNTPTKFANTTLLGTGDDRSNPSENKYYVTYVNDGVQLPFAIDIAFASDEDLNGFVIPAEHKRIDIYYPKFINWIKTAGKEDTDWYLHPVK